MVHHLHIVLFCYNYFPIFGSEIIWSLCPFHKTKYRLFLLKIYGQNCPSNLEIVFKHFVQMKRCLNLHQRSKFRCVVFNVEFTRVIFVNVRMQSADRDIMNSNISVMASTKSDFVDIVEVNHMDTSLLILFIFICVYLE